MRMRFELVEKLNFQSFSNYVSLFYEVVKDLSVLVISPVGSCRSLGESISVRFLKILVIGSIFY
jgi:hypothetical protein